MRRARTILAGLAAAALCVGACGSSSTTSGATTSKCAAAGGACAIVCAVEAPNSAQDCTGDVIGPAGVRCCLDLGDSGAPDEAGHNTSAPHDGGHSTEDGGHDAPHVTMLDAPSDATPDVGVTAPALDAAPNQWTFSTIPGTACLSGSETGFAVNPASTATDDLLIFIEGGGACWDGESCWGPVSTSFYVATGYGAAEFATDPQVDLYVLDRSNTQNPFRAMNMVFVPYCTGDVLAGDRVTSLEYLGTSHDTHFVGYSNLTIFLRSIAATFPHTSHVWLAGDSAGGFGAALNLDHVTSALRGVKVDVLDDSGQPIEPAPGRWAMWEAAWNMQIPSGCPDCKTDPGAFVAYYASKYPAQRFGLISYQYDIVISPFMDLTLTQFNTELDALATNMDAHWANGHYFIIPGSSHVGLLAPTPALMTWVTAMVTGDASWASSKP